MEENIVCLREQEPIILIGNVSVLPTSNVAQSPTAFEPCRQGGQMSLKKAQNVKINA
jgi:hypothetical protein